MMRTAWSGLGGALDPSTFEEFTQVSGPLVAAPEMLGQDPSAGAPGARSAIPGFLNSGAFDTGNPFTSSATTALAGLTPTTAVVLAGGVGVALLLLLTPSPPSGSRRR
jgi:hypothetical protein